MRNLTTSEIIGGLFIGAVLLLILTRKDESQQISDLRQSQVGIYGWKPLDSIQNFDDFNLKMTQSSQPVIQSETQNADQISQSVEQKAVEQIPDNSTAYKNEEKWKIIRDDNGDIAEISVSRDAKVT
jgi:nitrogen regulatory protein PII-like uncharacterized protein